MCHKIRQNALGCICGSQGTIFGGRSLFINFETLDGGAAWVVYGSYLGDGVDGRFFGLGFTPKEVIVKRPNNYQSYRHTSEVAYAPAMAVRGVSGNTLNVVEEGFLLSGHGLVNEAQTEFIFMVLS